MSKSEPSSSRSASILSRTQGLMRWHLWIWPRVDARTDLYSLGAVGYYLVTGETVFSGLSVGEVLLQQVKAEPDRPSARLRKPLPADFEDLLLRCLAKKPEDRPATAPDLEEALGRCAAATQWDRGQAEDCWRRRDAANTEQTMVMKESKPHYA